VQDLLVGGVVQAGGGRDQLGTDRDGARAAVAATGQRPGGVGGVFPILLTPV